MIERIIKKLILFVAFFPILISAETYTIDSGNMTLELDNLTWDVFTRDNIFNNDKLAKYNLTDSDILELMVKNDFYIDAINIGSSSKNAEFFVIKKYVGSTYNFANYSIKEVRNIARESALEFNSTTYDVYETKYKYSVFQLYDSGYYVVNYYTVIDGYGYVIKLEKTSTPLTSDELDTMKKIVSTVTFPKTTAYNETNKSLDFQTIVLIGAAIISSITIGYTIYASFKKKYKGNMNQFNNYQNIESLEAIKNVLNSDCPKGFWVQKNIRIVTNLKLLHYDDMKLIPNINNTSLKDKSEIFQDLINSYMKATMAATFYDTVDIEHWDFIYSNMQRFYLLDNVLTDKTKEELNNIKSGNNADKLIMSWLYEECAIYLWALNLTDFPNQDKQCNVDLMNKIMFQNESNMGNFPNLFMLIFDTSTKSMNFSNLNLKNIDEILEKADLLNRYKWAYDETNLKNDQFHLKNFPFDINIINIQLNALANMLNWTQR